MTMDMRPLLKAARWSRLRGYRDWIVAGTAVASIIIAIIALVIG